MARNTLCRVSADGGQPGDQLHSGASTRLGLSQELRFSKVQQVKREDDLRLKYVPTPRDEILYPILQQRRGHCPITFVPTVFAEDHRTTTVKSRRGQGMRCGEFHCVQQHDRRFQLVRT